MFNTDYNTTITSSGIICISTTSRLLCRSEEKVYEWCKWIIYITLINIISILMFSSICLFKRMTKKLKRRMRKVVGVSQETEKESEREKRKLFWLKLLSLHMKWLSAKVNSLHIIKFNCLFTYFDIYKFNIFLYFTY